VRDLILHRIGIPQLITPVLAELIDLDNKAI